MIPGFKSYQSPGFGHGFEGMGTEEQLDYFKNIYGFEGMTTEEQLDYFKDRPGGDKYMKIIRERELGYDPFFKKPAPFGPVMPRDYVSDESARQTFMGDYEPSWEEKVRQRNIERREATTWVAGQKEGTWPIAPKKPSIEVDIDVPDYKGPVSPFGFFAAEAELAGQAYAKPVSIADKYTWGLTSKGLEGLHPIFSLFNMIEPSPETDEVIDAFWHGDIGWEETARQLQAINENRPFTQQLITGFMAPSNLIGAGPIKSGIQGLKMGRKGIDFSRGVNKMAPIIPIPFQLRSASNIIPGIVSNGGFYPRTLFQVGNEIIEGANATVFRLSKDGRSVTTSDGRRIPIGGGSEDWGGTAYVAAPVANPFGIPTVKVGLTKTEWLYNFIAKLPYSPLVEKDTWGLALHRAQTEMATTADNLSTSMANEFDVKMQRAFNVEKNGTVLQLKGIVDEVPGAPTIADIAARLPLYWDSLTREQQAFMLQLRERLAPIKSQMEELGMTIKQRQDIMSGSKYGSSEGYYLGRGNAVKEGGEQPYEIPSKFKKPGVSFKNPARFTSQSEGVELGYKYVSFKGALESYIKQSGNNSADQWASNVLKAKRNETGELIGTTTKMRLAKEPIAVRAEKYIKTTRNKRRTLEGQNVRASERVAQAQKAAREAERVTEAAEGKITKAGERATDSLKDAVARTQAAERKLKDAGAFNRDDLKEARKAVLHNISLGRNLVRDIKSNFAHLKVAKSRLRKADRKLEKLTAEFERSLLEAQGLERIVDDDLTQEMPTAALGRKYQRLMNRADRIEDNTRKLRNLHDDLEDRIDDLRANEELLEEADEISRANLRKSRLAERELYATEDLERRLKSELLSLQREEARMVRLAEKAEKRDVNRIIRDVEKHTGGAARLDERAARALIRVHESKAAIQDLVSQYEAIKGELDHIKDLAKRPPGTGTIDLPGLGQYRFPALLAKTMQDELIKNMPPTGKTAPYVNALIGYANFYRSIRATADDSAVGIHGLLAAFANPKATEETFRQHWKAWGVNGERLLGEFVEDFNTRAMREGRLTTEDWARLGLRIGGEETEFLIRGGGIQRAPIIKQANRAFGFYGDKLRLEWADDFLWEQLRGGKTIDELRRSGKLREIADGTNTATGWTGGQFAGTAGELALFAPKFLQARLNNLTRGATAMVTDPLGTIEVVPGIGSKLRQGLEGRGARDISMDKRIARKAMLRFIGGATILTYGINGALGNETDERVMIKDKDGNWIYNSNFMRVRIGERDYSIFGTYDSLARLLVLSGSVHPDVGGSPLDAWRSMASGPVAMTWDVVSGKDFMGIETTADWVPGDNEALARLGYIFQEHVPFALEDAPNVAQQVREGEYGRAAVVAGGEIFGLKSSPLGFNDWVHEIAKENREKNVPSPTALGDEPVWDVENLSRGELRTIVNDPRLVKYREAMDIKKQGADDAFGTLDNNMRSLEQDLTNLLKKQEEGVNIPLGNLGDEIKDLKKGRSYIFSTFMMNPDNEEEVKALKDKEYKHRADYFGHKYWEIELECDDTTDYCDWPKFETDRKAVSDEAFAEGGETYVTYITEPSGPNRQNYRSERFSSPEVTAIVEEYEADQNIIKEYHEEPRRLVVGTPLEPLFDDFVRMSKSKQGQFLELADKKTKDRDGKLIVSEEMRDQIEAADATASILRALDEHKRNWRKQPENWLVEAKMWKWNSKITPSNSIVISMDNVLKRRSMDSGNLSYFNHADIEPLIQEISAVIRANPDDPYVNALRYLQSLVQPVGAR